MTARYPNHELFAIMPQQGDPLPQIGSGLRYVLARLGPKSVNVRYKGIGYRVPRRKWDMLIPHVRLTETDGTLTGTMKALRAWTPTITVRPVRVRRKRRA